MEQFNKETQAFVNECYKIGMNNPWCSGNVAREDGDFITEDDRLNRNSFTVFKDLGKLKEDLKGGNWGLGQAFMYNDLCFINQVDGGDEWLTIKRFDDEVISFESMSMARIIEGGRFEDMMVRLEKATKEQCRKLEY